MSVYVHEHIKWRGPNGEWISARQGSTHDLPVVLAQKAKRVGVALDVTDPQVARLRAALGDGVAIPCDPKQCIDLDLLDENVDIRRTGAIPVREQQQRKAQATAA
jgi:hypothetical protein